MAELYSPLQLSTAQLQWGSIEIKGLKTQLTFEREKEVETKVNGNIRRLPPETCLSSTIFCPIFFGHLF